MTDFIPLFAASLLIVFAFYKLAIQPFVDQWFFNRKHDRLVEARREQTRPEPAFQWPERIER